MEELNVTERAPTIFIADDDAEMGAVMATVLRDEGFAVACFRSGTELWRAIVSAEKRGEPPTLVISDIRMPDFTGLEILSGIVAGYYSIPVILVSGYANREVIEEATRLGAREVLPKPFALSDLLQSVTLHLRRRA